MTNAVQHVVRLVGVSIAEAELREALLGVRSSNAWAAGRSTAACPTQTRHCAKCEMSVAANGTFASFTELEVAKESKALWETVIA